MIKLEKTKVVGFEPAIRGMRNPKNSWDKSDSNTCEFYTGPETEHCATCPYINSCNADEGDIATNYIIGPKDHKLMMDLAKGGSVHAKYRRMIVVYVDITAPLYWWKEFDTYKVGTVANSCSTMHKIADKKFDISDFSCEHLNMISRHILVNIIDSLNNYRDLYLNGGEVDQFNGTFRVYEPKDKDIWWQIIQLLPSSYNQKRTVMLNYEVLANIYRLDSRIHHPLDEWSIDGSGEAFCKWIESLPYSEIITGKKEN